MSLTPTGANTARPSRSLNPNPPVAMATSAAIAAAPGATDTLSGQPPGSVPASQPLPSGGPSTPAPVATTPSLQDGVSVAVPETIDLELDLAEMLTQDGIGSPEPPPPRPRARERSSSRSPYVAEKEAPPSNKSQRGRRRSSKSKYHDSSQVPEVAPDLAVKMILEQQQAISEAKAKSELISGRNSELVTEKSKLQAEVNRTKAAAQAQQNQAQRSLSEAQAYVQHVQKSQAEMQVQQVHVQQVVAQLEAKTKQTEEQAAMHVNIATSNAQQMAVAAEQAKAETAQIAAMAQSQYDQLVAQAQETQRQRDQEWLKKYNDRESEFQARVDQVIAQKIEEQTRSMQEQMRNDFVTLENEKQQALSDLNSVYNQLEQQQTIQANNEAEMSVLKQQMVELQAQNAAHQMAADVQGVSRGSDDWEEKYHAIKLELEDKQKEMTKKAAMAKNEQDCLTKQVDKLTDKLRAVQESSPAKQRSLSVGATRVPKSERNPPVFDMSTPREKQPQETAEESQNDAGGDNEEENGSDSDEEPEEEDNENDWYEQEDGHEDDEADDEYYDDDEAENQEHEQHEATNNHSKWNEWNSWDDRQQSSWNKDRQSSWNDNDQWRQGSWNDHNRNSWQWDSRDNDSWNQSAKSWRPDYSQSGLTVDELIDIQKKEDCIVASLDFGSWPSVGQATAWRHNLKEKWAKGTKDCNGCLKHLNEVEIAETWEELTDPEKFAKVNRHAHDALMKMNLPKRLRSKIEDIKMKLMQESRFLNARQVLWMFYEEFKLPGGLLGEQGPRNLYNIKFSACENLADFQRRWDRCLENWPEKPTAAEIKRWQIAEIYLAQVTQDNGFKRHFTAYKTNIDACLFTADYFKVHEIVTNYLISQEKQRKYEAAEQAMQQETQNANSPHKPWANAYNATVHIPKCKKGDCVLFWRTGNCKKPGCPYYHNEATKLNKEQRRALASKRREEKGKGKGKGKEKDKGKGGKGKGKGKEDKGKGKGKGKEDKGKGKGEDGRGRQMLRNKHGQPVRGRSPSGKNNDAVMCKYFKAGRCHKGGQCDFWHPGKCKDWCKTGKCVLGNECSFRHDSALPARADPKAKPKAKGKSRADKKALRDAERAKKKAEKETAKALAAQQQDL